MVDSHWPVLTFNGVGSAAHAVAQNRAAASGKVVRVFIGSSAYILLRFTDDFVALDGTVADVDDAVGVLRNIVFVGD